MIKKNQLKIRYAVHPGITLKEKLEEMGMSPEEFAIKIDLPVEVVLSILNEKSPITSNIAIKLEKVLGIPASFWINKQINYDILTN
ncbi:MAG: HigA family addiction module antidote protein [Sulfurihydrogenibium sp.]|nr:HigA family addiction module antidote protein [Sulfurihydrogenibium sp.]